MNKVTLRHRAERFCAKLNDGLTAVAIVLAMMVFVVGTYRTLENVETAIAADDANWNAAAAAPDAGTAQQE